MFGIGKKKKARGIELIYEVAGRFTDMIDELECGVEDCNAERNGLKAQMEKLHERDSVLTTSINKAVAMASNLRELLCG